MSKYNETGFQIGDSVYVRNITNLEFRHTDNTYCGWHDSMREFIGKAHKIKQKSGSGNLLLCMDDEHWWFCPAWLKKYVEI